MKAFLLTLLLAPALLAAPQDRGNRNRKGGQPKQDADAAAAVPVDAPPLTPEQAANILKQLDDIEGKFSKSRGDVIGGALARLKTASTSEKDALELYIACYKAVHFDKLNLKQTDFQEWRLRQEDHFKDPEFLGSLLLQARFLTMALQGQDAKEKEMASIVPTLQAFINDEIRVIGASVIHTTAGAVKDNDKKKPQPRGPGGGGARNFDSSQLLRTLSDSIQESEYSKAFQLEDYLVREDWAYVPLEIGAIYEQIIFPYYLDKKPGELAAQWDLRIKSQLALKAATYTEVEYQTYYKDHFPEMLWKKSRYLLANNVDAVHALADMLKVIRDNPGHPKAGDWIKEMRDMLNRSQQPTGSGTGLSEANPAGTPAAPTPAQ